MPDIVIITDNELRAFRASVARETPEITELRVTFHNGFRVKFNGEDWSPSIGVVEPAPTAEPTFVCARCEREIVWNGAQWLLDGDPAVEDLVSCIDQDGQAELLNLGHLPTTRTDELVLRLALPQELGGWRVLEAHSWRPGTYIEPARINGLMYSASRAETGFAPFAVATLYLMDREYTSDGHPAWHCTFAHFDLTVLAHAREVAHV